MRTLATLAIATLAAGLAGGAQAKEFYRMSTISLPTAVHHQHDLRQAGPEIQPGHRDPGQRHRRGAAPRPGRGPRQDRLPDGGAGAPLPDVERQGDVRQGQGRPRSCPRTCARCSTTASASTSSASTRIPASRRWPTSRASACSSDRPPRSQRVVAGGFARAISGLEPGQGLRGDQARLLARDAGFPGPPDRRPGGIRQSALVELRPDRADQQDPLPRGDRRGLGKAGP